jgi:hypothetical protein
VVANNGHYLVVAKVRWILAVNKQRSHIFNMNRFNLKKLKVANGKEQNGVEVSKRFSALEDLNTEVEINTVWEIIRENTKISARVSKLL